MTLLTQSCRQLVVEAALAGVNHGLFKESRTILEALPLLVPDPEVRLLCQAMLLFGLGERQQALQLLEKSQSADALALRQLLAPELFPADTQQPGRLSH
ncbi:EscG/YscG/SsaH family type III secretion system needle protein co-chaperone [Candidatus Fukatsuia symbiotica]|uniref:EscG/YscG/SsaH family type III secretion system needle protein co-chaperone n=1 Tax=Candidatus Fukatsuia symbiotica TaxID=1878942 RepID=A0A2U8I4C8_9GAMM|nr:EscG/YscG/SsaH family type III secretion system needle protein co-chaperone [Candidatus Fukatsuia symbiotica]AWK13993.1 EscG/YscG/SsaH family type III secretion system needle protein co-chaperone [Candidatus Fukatsuia symbiotica]MEA9445662.1 EscG/YscG/SsaH family type III secretion system needle protein co-chaperone [Candidatus Fukatsuia symbiotica]